MIRIKKVGVMCGARWYRRSDWRRYKLFWVAKSTSATIGFGIGPILFWDGS